MGRSTFARIGTRPKGQSRPTAKILEAVSPWHVMRNPSYGRGFTHAVTPGRLDTAAAEGQLGSVRWWHRGDAPACHYSGLKRYPVIADEPAPRRTICCGSIWHGPYPVRLGEFAASAPPRHGQMGVIVGLMHSQRPWPQSALHRLLFSSRRLDLPRRRPGGRPQRCCCL